MEVGELKIGKSLEVDVERDGMIYHHNSKIEAVVDKTIYITPIANKRGEPFIFMPDDKISVIYRLGEKLWKWKGVKAGRGVYEGDVLLAMTVRLREGESFNRREAFRVFFGSETTVRRRILDIEKVRDYRMLHPEITDLSSFQDIEECYTTLVIPVILKDVSENGIGIFSSEKIPERTELSMTIPTEFGVISVSFTIVRGYVDYDREYKYFYGCKIIKVSANINRVLINLQRRQMALSRFDKKTIN